MSEDTTLTTIKDKNGKNQVVTVKDLLKELTRAEVALRRINFLSEIYGYDNMHLQEIKEISKKALSENKRIPKNDK